MGKINSRSKGDVWSPRALEILGWIDCELGIALFGAFVLFIPSKLAETFGLENVRSISSPWLGLATLAAFAFWLVQLVPQCQALCAGRRFRAARIRALDFLSPEEWILLAYCLLQNQQTITLSIIDRNAGSLVAQGILVQAGGVGNKLAWPYKIPSFLWEHLLKHRDQFMMRAPFPKDQVEHHLAKLHWATQKS